MWTAVLDQTKSLSGPVSYLLTLGESRCLEKSGGKWQVYCEIPLNIHTTPNSYILWKLLKVEVIPPLLTDSSYIFFLIFFQCFGIQTNIWVSLSLVWGLATANLYTVWRSAFYSWFEPVTFWFCLISYSSRTERKVVPILHHFWTERYHHTSLCAV